MDYKNQFVDENSYLAYADKPDTAYDGSGGGGGSYELPAATNETLGGVIIGDGITITENGVISATGGSGASAIPVTYDGDYVVLGYTAQELISMLRAGDFLFWIDIYNNTMTNHYLGQLIMSSDVAGAFNFYHFGSSTPVQCYYAALDDYPRGNLA